MSYVMAAPETMASAATDLAGIGSNLREAQVAAAPPTVTLAPAAGDEVSAGIAHLFSRYADDFQGLVAKATRFHEEFAQRVAAGAHSYAAAEGTNVSYLLWLLQNAGLYATTQALVKMLRSSSPFLNVFFQLLQYVLAPIRLVLAVGIILLFFAAIGVAELLANFFRSVGL